MSGNPSPTKILFIDNDEAAFQFRKCMVNIIPELPPIELFHANDATEALQMIERLKPHVVVLDDESSEERDLLLDSLSTSTLPIVLQTEETFDAQKASALNNTGITYITKNESLEGLHRTLLTISAIGSKSQEGVVDSLMH